MICLFHVTYVRVLSGIRDCSNEVSGSGSARTYIWEQQYNLSIFCGILLPIYIYVYIYIYIYTYIAKGGGLMTGFADSVAGDP